ETPTPVPSARVPNYPRELEHIVMKALAKTPGERYPTAQALQLDLEEFAREHKLAMSSIRIAKLMGTLFEKRNDAWIRAQRAHSDHFIEVSSQGSDGLGMPAFLAVGSAPSTPASDASPERTPVPLEHRTPMPAEPRPTTGASGVTPAPVAVPRRSRALWLVGAVLAGAAAVAITMADKAMVGSNDQAALAALNADVEKLATTLDGAARSAHLRADGIATTPMLRAAIETDAATLSDLANTEMVFTADHGEVLEV